MSSRRSHSVQHRPPANSQRDTGAAAPAVAGSSRRPGDVGLTRLTLGVGWGIALAFLGLYVATAARSIVVGDNPELIVAAVLFGVAHPPGYPLLVLIGHLFSLLPLGPVAFRVNLLATACGAGTV